MIALNKGFPTETKNKMMNNLSIYNWRYSLAKY